MKISAAPILVLAGAEAAEALRLGHPTPADPQYSPDGKYSYPPAAAVETVEDGQVVRLGTLAITAHRTPGHNSCRAYADAAKRNLGRRLAEEIASNRH